MLKAIRAANNDITKFQRGWYVVRNRSSEEAKAGVSRDEAKRRETELFTRGSWAPGKSGLKMEQLGIAALRDGLCKVFCDNIQEEFPKAEQQLRDLYEKKVSSLAEMGEARTTEKEQRDYLEGVI